MIVVLTRSGPPEAMTCPAILCDTCLTPIHDQRPYGLVLWRDLDDGTQQIAHVHKGRCDRTWEAKHPGPDHWMSAELGVFLDQLRGNVEEPFPAEDNVEYVAPKPSRWRQGHYRRPRDA